MVRQDVPAVELPVRGSRALMERSIVPTAIRKFGGKDPKTNDGSLQPPNRPTEGAGHHASRPFNMDDRQFNVPQFEVHFETGGGRCYCLL